jgi:hypothetical protein
MHKRDEKGTKILATECEEKRLLGRPRYKWEDIKMAIRETMWGVVWISCG